MQPSQTPATSSALRAATGSPSRIVKDMGTMALRATGTVPSNPIVVAPVPIYRVPSPSLGVRDYHTQDFVRSGTDPSSSSGVLARNAAMGSSIPPPRPHRMTARASSTGMTSTSQASPVLGRGGVSRPPSPGPKVLFQDIYHPDGLLSSQTYPRTLEALRASPSMSLLQTAADSLNENGPAAIQRMQGEETTTQVFEVVRKGSSRSNGRSGGLGQRQKSLIAVFKPDTVVSPTAASSMTSGSSLLSSTMSAASDATDGSDRAGLFAHERAIRERAAYVLDKSYDHFSRVPATALAKVNDHQQGSLQAFVRNEGSVDDNPKLLSMASAEEVQRIAVLDCRIFNTDRHSGNILVRKAGPLKVFDTSPSSSNNSSGVFRPPSRTATASPDAGDDTFHVGEQDAEEAASGACVELHPIDHALSLPSWCFLSEAFFDWEFWKQSSTPLAGSTIQHITNLDAERDAKCLRELGIREECVATNKIATLALKRFAQQPGTTLAQLARFFQRPYPKGHHQFDSCLSPIERLVDEACTQLGVIRSDCCGAGKGHNGKSVPREGTIDRAPPAGFYEKFAAVIDVEIGQGTWSAGLR